MNLKERRGVTLIVSVGILALVAIIATTFAINMQAEQKAAANYLNSVKAKNLAEVGIDKVIADIRNQVKSAGGYSSVVGYISGYSTAEQTITDIGTYAVTITPQDQKINLNALDETDSLWIDTLVVLPGGLTYNDIAKIIDYRDSDSNLTTQLLSSAGIQNTTGYETNTKNAPYITAEEVKLVIGSAKYDAIKDDITVFVPIIRGGLVGKYFADVSTFSASTIFNLTYYKGKVVELGRLKEPTAKQIDSVWGPWGTVAGADDPFNGWAEGHDAEFAGAYLSNSLLYYGVDKFGVIWTGFIDVPPSKVGSSTTFYIRAEDGVRFYVDGNLVIDDWGPNSMDPEVTNTYTFNSPGWHPIEIRLYDVDYLQGLELRWDALGSKDYVPAAYLGYYPASYFGSYPPATPVDAYNSAGLYKITSIGRAKTSGGTPLAEKKITALVRVFGTWTQTTRAEFYGAFYSEYNDLSDGETKNVTWMDSCPKNATDNLEASGYFSNLNDTTKFQKDALKLGFWDNFDEDVAYSFVMFRGDEVSQIWSATWATPQKKAINQSWAPSTTYYVTYKSWASKDDTNSNGYRDEGDTLDTEYQPFRNADGADGDNEFVILSLEKQGYRARVNENYYTSDASSQYDLFIRVWEKDSVAPTSRSPGGGLPEPLWMVGQLYLKGPAYPWGGGGEPWSYRNLLKDGDGVNTGDDSNELNLNPGGGLAWQLFAYSQAKVLAAAGIGTAYQSFIDGALACPNTGVSTQTGVVKLHSCNFWAADMTDFWIPYRSAGNGILCGAVTNLEAYFDNLRFIPKSGYFASTPFTENYNVNWGTMSWSQENVANTNIAMYARAGATLATTDTGWSSVANSGDALSATGSRFQYKAVLSTSAFSTTTYTANGVTPILKDVTVTYLPQVEIIYYKQETQ